MGQAKAYSTGAKAYATGDGGDLEGVGETGHGRGAGDDEAVTLAGFLPEVGEDGPRPRA